MTTFQKIPANAKSLRQRKLKYGVGINDAWYMVTPLINGKQRTCYAYRTWANMLSRCYNHKCHEKQPTYINCTVCKEWLTFSNFAKWFEENYTEGRALDKDIKIKDNKIYGPDKCLMVPTCINSLFTDSMAVRGCLAVGVWFDEKRALFRTQINIDGVIKTIGRYPSEQQAYKAYVKSKNAEIMRKCGQYPEFAEYLIQHLLTVEVQNEI